MWILSLVCVTSLRFMDPKVEEQGPAGQYRRLVTTRSALKPAQNRLCANVVVMEVGMHITVDVFGSMMKAVQATTATMEAAVMMPTR